MDKPTTLNSIADLKDVESGTTVLLNHLLVELVQGQWMNLSNNGKDTLRCIAYHKPEILQGVKEDGVVSVVGLYRSLVPAKTDAHLELSHVIIEPYYY